MSDNYEGMSTVQLRTLVRERGLAKGAAVASARKEDLIGLLSGTLASIETPALGGDGASVGGGDLADAIARAISGKVSAGVDKGAVQEMVDTAITDALGEFMGSDDFKHAVEHVIPPRAGMTITMPELPAPFELGAEPVHCQFPEVLAWLRADVPVWLWGFPGGGKTHLGRQLARALGVDCYTMSIDETTTANKLLGFQNLVSGEYVPGWLYRPFKEGGLVVIDEIDTGNPGIIAGLNALISNGHYMFPSGETVVKHPMFRVMACANTKGTGAVAGYTARQRLDAATLNRFAVIEFGYDAGLEMQIACGVPSDSTPWAPCKPATEKACQSWVKWVQSVRERVGKHVLVSPRPSLLGVKALRAGIPAKDVAKALLFALCAEDTVSRIINECGSPEDIAN